MPNSMHNITPFTVVEMTDSINKLPAMPLRLAKLFPVKPVHTTQVFLDIKKGQITLVEHQDRSAPAQSLAGKGNKRSGKSIPTTHLPQSDIVRPEDIQDVRAFGSNEPEVAVSVINGKLQVIKNNLAMTKEMHRLGAIKGVIMDADGKTVLNDLYKIFECTKQSITLTFPATNKVNENPILTTLLNAKRKIEAAMGGVPFQRIECLCGSTFYDKLTSHQYVREAFNDWLVRNSSYGDNDYRKRGFTYGNVTFYEASEIVGGRSLVEETKAHLYPVGAGIFTEYTAPANWIETANTYGKPYYSRMDEEPNGRGFYIEGQSNPLMLCNFPEALVEVTAA